MASANGVSLSAQAQYGKLGFDQFVLSKHVGFSHSHDPKKIWTRLILDWLSLGTTGRLPFYQAAHENATALPNPNEIAELLQSHMTVSERNLCAYIERQGGFRLLCLRPVYDSHTDTLHNQRWQVDIRGDVKEYASVVLGGDPKLGECLLNDPDLYSFGEDWERVFERFPVLADWLPFEEATFEGCVRKAQEEWKREDYDSDESDSEQDLSTVYNYLHEYCVRGVLLVEDLEALETGNLKLLWLDEYGHVIRQYRGVQWSEIENVTASLEYSRFATEGRKYWTDADVGLDYRPGGSRGGPFTFPLP